MQTPQWVPLPADPTQTLVGGSQVTRLAGYPSHGGPVPSTPVTLPPLPLGSWCLCALVCLSEQQFSKAQYVVRLSGCISELKTKTKKNPNPLLVFILLHFLEYSFFLHLLPDNLVPSSWGFI